jgi:CO dehydrogenase maturation factor
MSFTIAVAGKGGTGKSTLSSLIIRHLVKTGQTPVLAVDADADANLAGLLGIKEFYSLGDIREDVIANVNNIPASMPKEAFVELKLEDVLVENKGFDLVVMGRPEGKGCYCYVNTLLRKYMQQLTPNYKYVVMDNQAGLEHLSRHTTQNVDVLLLVSDPSIKGINTAVKANELAKELKLNVKKVFLVVSRLSGEVPQQLKDYAEKNGLSVNATIPYDEEVMKFDLNEESILNLDDNSKIACAVTELMDKIVD